MGTKPGLGNDSLFVENPLAVASEHSVRTLDHRIAIGGTDSPGYLCESQEVGRCSFTNLSQWSIRARGLGPNPSGEPSNHNAIECVAEAQRPRELVTGKFWGAGCVRETHFAPESDAETHSRVQN